MSIRWNDWSNISVSWMFDGGEVKIWGSIIKKTISIRAWGQEAIGDSMGIAKGGLGLVRSDPPSMIKKLIKFVFSCHITINLLLTIVFEIDFEKNTFIWMIDSIWAKNSFQKLFENWLQKLIKSKILKLIIKKSTQIFKKSVLLHQSPLKIINFWIVKIKTK